ncbi:LysR substrate-binding domain-containing protein, partial [Turicimonas muris]
DRPGRIRHLILEESYFVLCNKKFSEELRSFEKDAFRGVELPFISYRSNSADRRKAQSFLRRIGLNSTVSYELENTRSVIRAVENGLGWTILPPLNVLLGDDTCLLSVRKIDDPSLKKRLFIATDRPMLNPIIEELEGLFFETFDFLCGHDSSEVFNTLKTGMNLPEHIS